MKQISKSSILSAAIGAGAALSAVEAFEEPQVDKSVVIERLNSKKAIVDGEVRFIAEAKMPDGGVFAILLNESACVIPTRSVDGGEDVVDCECRDSIDAGYRWRGRNVCPRENARGSACVPSACSVTAGRYKDEDLF